MTLVKSSVLYYTTTKPLILNYNNNNNFINIVIKKIKIDQLCTKKYFNNAQNSVKFYVCSLAPSVKPQSNMASICQKARFLHTSRPRAVDVLFRIFIFFNLQCNPVSSLFYISSYTRNIKTLCTVMRAISSLRDIKMRVLVSSFFISSFFVLSVESSRVFTRLCLRVVDWVTEIVYLLFF